MEKIKVFVVKVEVIRENRCFNYGFNHAEGRWFPFTKKNKREERGASSAYYCDERFSE